MPVKNLPTDKNQNPEHLAIKNYLEAVEVRVKAENAFHTAKAAAIEKVAKSWAEAQLVKPDVIPESLIDQQAMKNVPAEYLALELARARETVAGAQFYRLMQGGQQ